MHKHSYHGEQLTKVAKIAVREDANYKLKMDNVNVLIKINQPETSLVCSDVLGFDLVFNFAGDHSIIEDVVEASKASAGDETVMHKFHFKSHRFTPKFSMVARKPSFEEVLASVKTALHNLETGDKIDSDEYRIVVIRKLLQVLTGSRMMSRKGGLRSRKPFSVEAAMRASVSQTCKLPHYKLTKPNCAYPKTDVRVWAGLGATVTAWDLFLGRLKRETLQKVMKRPKEDLKTKEPEKFRYGVKILPKPGETHSVKLLFTSEEARQSCITDRKCEVKRAKMDELLNELKSSGGCEDDAGVLTGYGSFRLQFVPVETT